MSVVVLIGAIVVGNACTDLFRGSTAGPPNRFVEVEYRPDAWKDVRYSPRQVLLHIGPRCITGTGRDGTEYLLLFETGRELVKDVGSQAITGVYRPALTLLRPAPTSDTAQQTTANSRGADDSDTLYIDIHGDAVRRDRNGFWVGAHGEEWDVESFAREGVVADGELMLTSVRGVGHPGLRWLTTPHPECERYPHAWVPDGLPT